MGRQVRPNGIRRTITLATSCRTIRRSLARHDAALAAFPGAAPGRGVGEFFDGGVDGGEFWLDTFGPVGDQTPVHQSASALASFIHANHGNVLGGSDVVARGELPFGAHESEFALDRGFVGGYVAAAHCG